MEYYLDNQELFVQMKTEYPQLDISKLPEDIEETHSRELYLFLRVILPDGMIYEYQDFVPCFTTCTPEQELRTTINIPPEQKITDVYLITHTICIALFAHHKERVNTRDNLLGLFATWLKQNNQALFGYLCNC